MRKLIRKITLSVCSIILIVVTMVTTTYAWVGMLSYSSVGGFDINLQAQKKISDYSLFISSTGEEDDFGETLSQAGLINIKKQVLENMGKFDDKYLGNDAAINSAFNTISLGPASPKITNNSVDLSTFSSFQKETNGFAETKSYLKYDIYLMIDSSNGEVTSSTTFLIDLYLENISNSLTGNEIYGSTIKNMEYTDEYKNYVLSTLDSNSKYKTIDKISTNDLIKTNSSYSTRLGLQYYAGIPVSDSYNGTELPLGQYIFQSGTKDALYNSENSSYSFGGVLEEKNNFGINEFNSVYTTDLVEKYNKYADDNSQDDFDALVSTRKQDLQLSDENKMICDNPDLLKLGVINGTKYKIKMTIYFWFEGWDADSFNVLENTKASMNLTFTSNFNQE